MEQPTIEDWSDSTNFVKAENVKTFPALFIPLSVSTHYDDDEKAHYVYTGEFDKKKKQWEPNKTNIAIIKEHGLMPKDLIGKKVWFKLVENFNPTLKKRVPALEIEKIE